MVKKGNGEGVRSFLYVNVSPTIRGERPTRGGAKSSEDGECPAAAVWCRSARLRSPFSSSPCITMLAIRSQRGTVNGARRAEEGNVLGARRKKVLEGVCK